MNEQLRLERDDFKTIKEDFETKYKELLEKYDMIASEEEKLTVKLVHAQKLAES